MKKLRVRNCCHYCKLPSPPRFLVPCKIPCGLYFCRKCLIKYYKFSRVKCSKLPTANWKCPVCTIKCQCSDCRKSNSVQPIEKVQKNKELMKLKKRNPEELSDKESNYSNPHKLSSSIYEPKCKSIVTPEINCKLPHILGN